MVNIKDILTKEEIEEYGGEWNSFKGRCRLNASKNVHSGMPVISEVYQFEDKPIFRAHVFGRRLRKFDPYFIASEHPMPFWNAQHYLMVGEQMYSASLHLAIGNKYNERVAKEVPIEFNWKKPTFFIDNVSVELIRVEEGKLRGYDKETGYFTIYSDKTGRVLSRMSAMSFWQDRNYVQLLDRLRQGDKSAIEKLLRVIEAQDLTQRRRTPKRQTLTTSKEELIELVRLGQYPQEKFDDFFSLWD